MSKTLWAGRIVGILSAVAYGLNPLFAVPMYGEGMSTASVLFYRFLFALFLMGGWMIFARKSFLLPRKMILIMVGASFALLLSCLSLFLAFRLMDVGLASTILFIYPIMVALIMAFGFREKLSFPVWLGTILAFGGVFLLYFGGSSGGNATLGGLLLTLLSALSYAVYMVILRISRLKELQPETITFYAILFAIPVFFLLNDFGRSLTFFPGLLSFGCAVGLALFPSLCAFLLAAVAIRHIGPTRTAIIGAMEPVTALCVGCFVFGEKITPTILAGVVLILFAVTFSMTEKKNVSGSPE